MRNSRGLSSLCFFFFATKTYTILKGGDYMLKKHNTEEEEKKDNKFKVTLRFLAISTVCVGGAYLMGAYKGIGLGEKLGYKAGHSDGYAKAASDIAYIVKEAKEKVDA